jgi:hypothetical protein
LIDRSFLPAFLLRLAALAVIRGRRGPL